MMAADLHQQQLLLPPPSPLFPTHKNNPLISPDQILQVSGPHPTSGSNSMSGPSTPVSASENRGEEDEYIGMDEFTAELSRRVAQYMLPEDEDDFPLPSIDLPNQYQSGYESGGFNFKGTMKRSSWSSADSTQSPLWLWSPPINSSRIHCARQVPYDLISRFDEMNLYNKFLQCHQSYAQQEKENSAPPLLSHHPNLAHEYSRPCMSPDAEPYMNELNQAIPTKNGNRKSNRYYWQHQRTRHLWGTGMQAVFLGEAGSGSKSHGTGVFLPRRAGNSTESRRQPRCSTVLIPNRVAHALMTHYERTGSPSRSRASPDKRFGLYFQEKSQSRAAAVRTNGNLPQEWIY